jgi:hypothetical protein
MAADCTLNIVVPGNTAMAMTRQMDVEPLFPSFWINKTNPLAGVVLAIPVAFLVGALYPPQLVLIFNPRYSPPPPASDSKHGMALMEQTERELQELFIVHKMKGKKDWYETRECLLARDELGIGERQLDG